MFRLRRSEKSMSAVSRSKTPNPRCFSSSCTCRFMKRVGSSATKCWVGEFPLRPWGALLRRDAHGKCLTYWVFCLYTRDYFCIGPMELKFGGKLLLGFVSSVTTPEKKMLIFYMFFFHAKLKILENLKILKNHVEFF